MNEQEKFRIKVFFWDQLIRPIKSLLYIDQINALLVAALIVNLLFIRKAWLSLLIASMLLTFSIINLVKYYRSGEYIGNYRKERYSKFKQAIKEIKKEKSGGEDGKQAELQAHSS